MSEYPLIIEKGSNYAFVINESKNLDFDKIRDYSTEFYKMLPSKMQERLYDEIMHGACELDSEPKLNAYMFALGKMHNAKLQYAYDHLSDEFLNEKQIDIIDYACGQGVGTICYADFLKRKHLNQNVRRIILIEPSEKALARAALNISAIFPDAELVTINKGFDDLTNDDLFPDKDTPTLHVISNVLEMATTYNSDGFFDLEDFANLISRAIDGKNEFVCVEPLFGYAPKDEKVDAFIRAAGIEIYCSITKGKREFVDNKDWTCAVRVGSVYKKENIKIDNKIYDIKDLGVDLKNYYAIKNHLDVMSKFKELRESMLYICPYCQSKSLKIAATTIKQDGYYIRQCEKCTEKKRKISISIYIIFSIIIPVIIGIILKNFIGAIYLIFVGLCLSSIFTNRFINKKVDIKDAARKDAIDENAGYSDLFWWK